MKKNGTGNSVFSTYAAEEGMLNLKRERKIQGDTPSRRPGT
jgi:hypothetical protein